LRLPSSDEFSLGVTAIIITGFPRGHPRKKTLLNWDFPSARYFPQAWLELSIKTPHYFLGYSVPGFQNKKQQFSWVLSLRMLYFYSSSKMVLSGRISWEGRTLNYIMCGGWGGVGRASGLWY